jgi:GTPase SAR1 family protein
MIQLPKADCFIIVYDITKRPTFDSVVKRWIPEIAEFKAKGKPFIIVGNKLDLRQDGDSNHISNDEALKAAGAMGASAFVECSAKTMEGFV